MLDFDALSRNAYCCVQFMVHRDRIRLRLLGCLGAVEELRRAYTQMSVFCDSWRRQVLRNLWCTIISINYYHSLSFWYRYIYIYMCVCWFIVYPMCPLWIQCVSFLYPCAGPATHLHEWGRCRSTSTAGSTLGLQQSLTTDFSQLDAACLTPAKGKSQGKIELFFALSRSFKFFQG